VSKIPIKTSKNSIKNPKDSTIILPLNMSTKICND